MEPIQGSVQVLRAKEHHHFQDPMLSAYWLFSFDQYYDPRRMAFGPLRVFNDDTVQPGGGWPMHPHRDMEIITYVVEGAIAHRDSSGGGGVVRAGEVQRMTAGTGIVHSEFNPSKDQVLRSLQIWILPDRRGHKPSYETAPLSRDHRQGKLVPVVTGRDMGGVPRIHQDATLYAGTLGREVTHAIGPGRGGYLFVIRGDASLDGRPLGERDVALIPGAMDVHLTGSAEVMLIDVPLS